MDLHLDQKQRTLLPHFRRPLNATETQSVRSIEVHAINKTSLWSNKHCPWVNLLSVDRGFKRTAECAQQDNGHGYKGSTPHDEVSVQIFDN